MEGNWKYSFLLIFITSNVFLMKHRRKSKTAPNKISSVKKLPEEILRKKNFRKKSSVRKLPE